MANFKTGKSRLYNLGHARINDMNSAGMMLGELLYDVAAALFIPILPSEHDDMIEFSFSLRENWSAYEGRMS